MKRAGKLLKVYIHRLGESFTPVHNTRFETRFSRDFRTPTVWEADKLWKKVVERCGEFVVGAG